MALRYLILVVCLWSNIPISLEQHPKFKTCQLAPDLLPRIDKDLRIWRKLGVSEQHVLNIGRMCHEVSLNATHPLGEWCHVRDGFNHWASPRFLISGGDVYLTHLNPEGIFVGHPDVVGFMLELYELSRTYELPDVEFAYWALDEAPYSQDLKLTDDDYDYDYGSSNSSDEDEQEQQDLKGSADEPPPYNVTEVEGPEGPVPLMVFSKPEWNIGLTVPCYSSTRCKDDFDTLYSNLEHFWSVPWKDRRELAFGRYNLFCTYYTEDYYFRASPEVYPECVRMHLHNLSDANPEVLNVGFVGERAQGGREFVPMHEQLGYKYLVSTDGWSISPKLERYMLLGSTVLKAHSDRISWFYDGIKPWQHYIPFLVDNSTDILSVVEYLRQHDAEAHRIAEAAREFAVTRLHKQSRMCYMFTLLTELAKTFRYTPSCSRRRMCVPLAREVAWLSKAHPNSCKFHELLLRHVRHDPLLRQPLPVYLEALHADRYHHGWEAGLRHPREPDWPEDAEMPWGRRRQRRRRRRGGSRSMR